jgi:glycosidase
MIFYELYLRSFYDSNGDGIGDFKGLQEKLDYFVDLGVDCIWFLPVLKSPAFHGYTISDFYETNPLYGNLNDLKKLLEEGHKKGLKFVLDLPVNHCAVNSVWFQKALKNEKPYYDWFLWSNEKTDLDEKRHWGGDKIWHKIGDKYFYGLFGPGSPDLNYNSKDLWKEMKKVFEKWLEIGFDGFRLDAAKHVFDYDEKKMVFKYQHDKNIEFWNEMLTHIKSIKKDAIIISEVWDDSDIVKKYDGVFEIGFNFPFSYILKNSVKKEDTKNFVDGIESCMSDYIDETAEIKTKSGNFLTNHDMTRLISELSDNEKKYRFALSLLFTLPGIPFIFYGEELGMKGIVQSVNYTEDCQEPIHWYDIGFGVGQTEWKGYKFNDPYSGVAIEKQFKDENSNFNFLRSLIAFRKENPFLSNAKIKILEYSKNMVKLKIFNEISGFIVYYNFKNTSIKINNKNIENPIIFGNFSIKNKDIYLDGYSVLISKY